MPSAAPAPPPSARPSRALFTRDAPALRPRYTHGRPSGAQHVPTLLLPCAASATVLSSARPAHRLTPVSELADADDQTTAVALSPDGALAALALRSGRLDIVDTATATVRAALRPFRDAAVISLLCFDSSAAFVALATADGNVRVHDARAGHVTHIFKTEGALITAMAWHPDPSQMALLLGMETGAVLLCDLSKKKSKPEEVARKHVGSVVAFAFADGCKSVVTAGADKLLCFAKWGHMADARIIAGGERFVALLTPGDGQGNVVLSLGEKGLLRKWDVRSVREDVAGGMTLPFTSGRGDQDGSDDDDDDDDEGETPILPIAMTHCGLEEIAVALSDQTVLYIPISTEGALSSVRDVVCGNLEEIYDLRPLRTRDLSAKVSNKGMRDFAVASNSSSLWIMRMTPIGDEVATTEMRPNGTASKEDGKSIEEDALWSCHAGLQGHSGIILCVDALTNPKAVGKSNVADAYLATSSRDKSARVWRRSRSSGKWTCMALAEGHTAAVGAVAISQRTAAEQFFIVSGAVDRTIKLWSLDHAQTAMEKVERGREKAEIAPNVEEQDWSARMEPDKNLEIANLSAKWTMLAHEKDVNAVAISPDAKIIATGSQDRSMKLWDASKGKLQFTCTGHKRGIWNVTFSSVDRIVASCSGDSTIRLWNVANGNCLRTFEGHLSGVLRSVFISSGTQLVSSGADGLVKIWTSKTGECVSTLDAHSDRGWALASVDDGDVLVTGGADGLLQLWRDTTEEQALADVERKEEEAILEQAVHNAARAGKWCTAARGALKLGMRQKLLGVIVEMVEKAEDSEKELVGMVRELGEDVKGEETGWELVTRLFLCCRDWNTVGGAKTAGVAMRVLKALFSVFSPDVLCENLVGVDKRALVEALHAHCGRHLERVNVLAARVSVLEHTLEKMRGLAYIEDKDQKGIGKKRKRTAKDVVRGRVEDAEDLKGVKRKRKNREEVAADY